MIAFGKYQGLGNDFVVIECDDADAFETRLARDICDRHFGVGADGVILVGPAGAGSHASMRVINADGSRPEMCGNGLRCVALHLARTRGEAKASYRVHTDAGLLQCRVECAADSGEVMIDMGSARDDAKHTTSFRGQSVEFRRISTGNPHAILFGSSYDLAAIDELGPRVSGELPGGANVEFVRQREDGSLDVVVWERGVGRTLACGTGACATVVAAALTGRARYGEELAVHLPGGTLHVCVSPGTLAMRMRGPARFVFGGSVSESFAR